MQAGAVQFDGKAYWFAWDSDEEVLRNARWNWFTARNYCRYDSPTVFHPLYLSLPGLQPGTIAGTTHLLWLYLVSPGSQPGTVAGTTHLLWLYLVSPGSQPGTIAGIRLTSNI